MRRGLMQWDPQELPLAALEARIAALRAGMASAGLDAFLIYTNLVRPSAVTWRWWTCSSTPAPTRGP